MPDPFMHNLLATLLVASMLGIGLRTTAAGLRTLLTSADLFLRLLVVNFFAIPILGLLIIKRIGFEPETAAAFALIAFTPGSVGTVQFSSRYKGHEALAGAMAVCLSVLAIFFSPAMLSWVIPEQYPVRVPYGATAMFVVLAMFLPLILGFEIRRRAERLAGRLASWATGTSTTLYVGYIILYYFQHRAMTHPIAVENLGYMLAFVLGCLLIGFAFGGPGLVTRAIMANASSMRHVSLALLIAAYTFNNKLVEANLTAFTLLMVGVNAGFALGMRIYLKRKS